MCTSAVSTKAVQKERIRKRREWRRAAIDEPPNPLDKPTNNSPVPSQCTNATTCGLTQRCVRRKPRASGIDSVMVDPGLHLDNDLEIEYHRAEVKTDTTCTRTPHYKVFLQYQANARFPFIGNSIRIPSGSVKGCPNK